MSKLLDIIKARRSATQSSGDRVRAVRLKSGKNRIRILPHISLDAEKPFFKQYGQHYIKDAGGKIIAVYTCDYATHGTRCEVCDAIQVAMMRADDADRKLLESARSGKKILVNAILHDSDIKTAQLLEFPAYTFDQQVLGLFETFAEDGVDFTSLTEGFDLIIERKGSTRMDTEYVVNAVPKSTKVDKSVMSTAVDLEAYVLAESEASRFKAVQAINVISSAAALLEGPSTVIPAIADIASAIDGEFSSASSEDTWEKSTAKVENSESDDDLAGLLAELESA
jgi:hypothetical protein